MDIVFDMISQNEDQKSVTKLSSFEETSTMYVQELCWKMLEEVRLYMVIKTTSNPLEGEETKKEELEEEMGEDELLPT